MNTLSSFRELTRASSLLLCIILLATGCVTTPKTDSIPPFRQAVLTAEQQTAQAFGEINAFLRERQLDRVALGDRLDEGDFETVLSPDAVAKWHSAFQLLDRYGQLLQTLLDPKRRDSFEGDLLELSNGVGALRDDELPDGLAAGFSVLGSKLLEARAQKDSMSAIKKADPGIQAVVRTMMDAIGADRSDGIRGTVDSSWATLEAPYKTQFNQASMTSKKRAIAADYIALLDQRDARDRSLASLRRSLGLLGDAHSELAAGRTGGARQMLEMLETERSRWITRTDEIEKKRASQKSNGESP